MNRSVTYYVPVTGNDNYTDVEVRIYYDKGGTDAYGRNVERGYYATIMPCKRERGFVTISPSDGYRIQLMRVHRYSDKDFTTVQTTPCHKGFVEQYIWSLCFKYNFRRAECGDGI